MQVRHLKIERFRGIKSLDWRPHSGQVSVEYGSIVGADEVITRNIRLLTSSYSRFSLDAPLSSLSVDIQIVCHKVTGNHA